MQKTTLLLTFIFLMAASPAISKQRSKDEIRNAAAKVLLIQDGMKTRAASDLQELYSTKSLTIMGTSNGHFAVVARDDKFPAILGYSTGKSEDGTFPDAMKWWAKAISHAMETQAPTFSAYDILNSGDNEVAKSIKPLITTTWNQNSPYNYMCPNTAKSGNYPTGCVATALAQIMNYHKYPEQGEGSYTYVFRPSDGTAYRLTANFGETTYDWANMLDNYSKNSYNDTQRDAVATLMSHCGISVNMSYNPSGSGAYSVEATNALRNYFRYNKNVRLYRRDFYSAQQWMDILYRELSNSRPVLYTGVDPASGGHAFVIDGYDEQGLVHVNWGWGGKSDGFFDISLLNPSGSKYSDGQEMIGNICKPDIDIPFASQLGAYPLNINIYGSTTKRLSISASVYSIGAEDFTGTIAAILQNGDTTIVAKKQENVSLKPASLGFFQPTDISLKSIDLMDIPDGTYRVFLGCRTEKDISWQLVKSYMGAVCNCVLTKNKGEYSTQESTDDTWAGTNSISPITYSKPDTGIYDLQGRSVGSDNKKLPKGIYIIGGKKVIK